MDLVFCGTHCMVETLLEVQCRKQNAEIGGGETSGLCQSRPKV